MDWAARPRALASCNPEWPSHLGTGRPYLPAILCLLLERMFTASAKVGKSAEHHSSDRPSRFCDCKLARVFRGTTISRGELITRVGVGLAGSGIAGVATLSSLFRRASGSRRQPTNSNRGLHAQAGRRCRFTSSRWNTTVSATSGFCSLRVKRSAQEVRFNLTRWDRPAANHQPSPCGTKAGISSMSPADHVQPASRRSLPYRTRADHRGLNFCLLRWLPTGWRSSAGIGGRAGDQRRRPHAAGC